MLKCAHPRIMALLAHTQVEVDGHLRYAILMEVAAGDLSKRIRCAVAMASSHTPTLLSTRPNKQQSLLGPSNPMQIRRLPHAIMLHPSCSQFQPCGCCVA